MNKNSRLYCCAALCLIMSCGRCPADQNGTTPANLLRKYCLACHNSSDSETGLSLHSTEAIREGSDNGKVLNVDAPLESRLLAVLAADAQDRMPPDGEPQPTPAELEILRKWVLDGASLDGVLGTATLPMIKPFDAPESPTLSSVYLPDQNAFCVGAFNSVELRTVDDGKTIWSAPHVLGKVSRLESAHRHDWIAAATGTPGTDGAAVLISKSDGNLLQRFAGHADSVYAVALNAEDTILATAGYDRRILLHDVTGTALIGKLSGHNGSVFDLAFDPSGRILCSASADGTVKVWDVKSLQRLDTLSQPNGEQYCVSISPDGQRIYAAGADSRIRVWQLVSVDRPQINPILTSRFAHEQPITSLELSQDGTLLATAAEDRTLRIWRAHPLAHLQTLPAQPAAVTSLSWIDSTRLFVTRLDSSSQLYHVAPDANLPSESSPQVMADLSPHDSEAVAPKAVAESEPNNSAKQPQSITIPAAISGVIHDAEGPDQDVFRFTAKAGHELLIEVNAQRSQSPLDSRIEVLDSTGARLLRTRLQAVRDSYFTFRGKDSDTSDDFRVFNWQEMELNEYLYSEGEVTRLWMYPRGPDSGFKVYPGFGKRYTFFGTTAISHPLHAPCFIVVPRQPDETIVANGLPTFPVYFENDDDPRREFGSDSRLFFNPQADGDYLLRITDARGFGGEDFKYTMTARAPQPDFSVSVGGRKISVAAGTGRELSFTANRKDGYAGPITVMMENLPPGFGFSGPVVIESEQQMAFGSLYAESGAAQPTPEQVKAIQLTSSADIGGTQVTHELPGLEELKLLQQSKLRVLVADADSQKAGATAGDAAAVVSAEPLVLEIRPGSTIRAFITLLRDEHQGIVSFGKEDAGRNLPFGVFVDNTGLNGLLLLEDQSEREFFIRATNWIPEQTRKFYLQSNVDGITSLPITLKVTHTPPADRQTVTSAN